MLGSRLGSRVVGMGMDFARCVGGKIGLETPELVGIPTFTRGRSSETALSSPGLLTRARTDPPGRADRICCLTPRFWLGRPNSGGFCCLLLE